MAELKQRKSLEIVVISRLLKVVGIVGFEPTTFASRS